MKDSRPLIIHVVYSFDVGGLENGVVNLINRMPPERFRHLILALTYCAPAFVARIKRDDVECMSLNKPAGHGFSLYPQLYRIFRELKPAVVHTRNLAALEMVVPAWLARVPLRIHGEHGWDSFDREGTSKKYQLVRKLYSPFVSGYIALSRKIESYLLDKIGIRAGRIRRICNGVDSQRFTPADGRQLIPGSPFNDGGLTVFGAVGRLQTVKDHANLIRAFGLFVRSSVDAARRARLIIVGGGPLENELKALISHEKLDQHIWLAGEQGDVPLMMRGFDVFVLPSLSEGISNTLLEAMACGLPIVATDVGGSGELVVHGETGYLVPAASSDQLAERLAHLFEHPEKAAVMGRAGRDRVQAQFSLDAMLQSYLSVYEQGFAGSGPVAEKSARSENALG